MCKDFFPPQKDPLYFTQKCFLLFSRNDLTFKLCVNKEICDIVMSDN